MTKLRSRKYLSEAVATVSQNDSPGGEDGSYARSTKEFFRSFVKKLAAAIPSNFVESGKKANVGLHNGSANIEGEAPSFTWSVAISRRWMNASTLDIDVSVSSPKPRYITFGLSSDSNPDEMIEDVVGWMVSKTKAKK